MYIKLYDIECWRADQPMGDVFLNDLSLINLFLKNQIKNNKDFLIEVFIDPASYNNKPLKGTINFIIDAKPISSPRQKYNFTDVLSLNATLAMTGWCPINDSATPNTVLYNDIAMSNVMGSWAMMDKAVSEGWWIMPLSWDKIDDKTKDIYKKLYDKNTN